MSSDVEICKLALSHLGDQYSISSLSEQSAEANLCRLLYEPSRDETMSVYPWNFAKTYESPATLSGTAPGLWSYIYKYPTNALRMLEITNPAGTTQPPIVYEVARHITHGKCVFTDQVDAELVYIQKITDPNEFDAAYIMALSYNIGMQLAMPLTGDQKLLLTITNLYANSINGAQVADANEGANDADAVPNAGWIDTRA